MQVFITIDTETAIPAPGPDVSFERLIGRGIWGECAEGDFGTRYIARVLHEHGLKAVFFTEALHASVFGSRHLEEIVQAVQSYGHEAQLHLHCEWMAHAPAIFESRSAENLTEFSLDEQANLLATAKNNLSEAGATAVTAYRAGNYGANNDTLDALVRNGIHFDASYNRDYLGDTCRISRPEALTGPVHIGDLVEVPVTFFYDRPGHTRALQLCACSLAEMRYVLNALHAAGARSATVVLHSFELLSRDMMRVEKIARARFTGLCTFLAENTHRFQTVGFNDVADWREADLGPNPPAVRSAITRTAWRIGEQIAGTLLYQRGKAA